MWMMPLHLHINQKSDYDYDMIRNLKMLIFWCILQVLRFEISLIEDFGNFELSPMTSKVACTHLTGFAQA